MTTMKFLSWWTLTKIVAWYCFLGSQCYAMLSSSGKWAGALDSGGAGNPVNVGLFTSSGLMASPDCWLDSLRTLNVDVTTTADACSWMTPTYQKLMALELARCHVTDLGRTLFDEAKESYNSAKCSNVKYRENLGDCLVHLTPSAETAYTHFLTYINQLCTRLSREIVMDQFYDISVTLAKAASEAKSQLQETLKQQENAWVTWKQREGLIVEFHDRLQEQLLQEHDRWTREGLQVLGQWQDDQEEWLRRQKDSQQGHLSIMVEQQEELRRQREELTRLSEALAHTHQSIQPWSLLSVEDLYRYVRMIYIFFRMTLHLACCIIIFLILTYPRCLSWLRRLLLPLIVAGAVVEAVLYVNLQSKDDWSNAFGTWAELSTTVRTTFGFLEAVLYVLGCLISPCFRGGDRSLNRGVDDDVDKWVLSNKLSKEHEHSRFKQYRNDDIIPYSRNETSPRQDRVEPKYEFVSTPSPPVHLALVQQSMSPPQEVNGSLYQDVRSQQKLAPASQEHPSGRGENDLHRSTLLDQVGCPAQPTKKEPCNAARERKMSCTSSDSDSDSDSSSSSTWSSSDRSSSSSSVTVRDRPVEDIWKARNLKRSIDRSPSLDNEQDRESRKRTKLLEEASTGGSMTMEKK